jgi:hypothetical protein
MAAPYSAAAALGPRVLPEILDAFLLPETELRTKGSGSELSLDTYTGGLLVFTLDITRVHERTSLDLSIWGSCDGQVWGARPLIHFPRKYHCGESKTQWDPAEFPFVQRIRAQWQVDRWGQGDGKPLIALALHVREVARHPAPVHAGYNR